MFNKKIENVHKIRGTRAVICKSLFKKMLRFNAGDESGCQLKLMFSPLRMLVGRVALLNFRMSAASSEDIRLDRERPLNAGSLIMPAAGSLMVRDLKPKFKTRNQMLKNS